MPKRSAAKKAPSSTRLGRIELLLEDVQTQVRSIAEGQVLASERMERSIAELRRELLARIEVLEAVVRQNSLDIRQNSEDIKKNSEDIRKNTEDIRKNSEDIRALRAEMAEMRHEVQLLATRTELRTLEARVATLEAKLAV